METVNPQLIGCEFVRQYYTMMHEAPEYIHRFSIRSLTFVHRGMEKHEQDHLLVIGQKEILKKIMMIFQDCHVKIRQVDIRTTVGNAVDVAVTGKLSKNGQPVGGFLQTFLLASNSPKKYYVHRTTLHYQDEVFHAIENVEDAQRTHKKNSEGGIVDGGAQTELIQDTQQFYDNHAPLRGSRLPERSSSQDSTEEIFLKEFSNWVTGFFALQCLRNKFQELVQPSFSETLRNYPFLKSFLPCKPYSIDTIDLIGWITICLKCKTLKDKFPSMNFLNKIKKLWNKLIHNGKCSFSDGEIQIFLENVISIFKAKPFCELGSEEVINTIEKLKKKHVTC